MPGLDLAIISYNLTTLSEWRAELARNNKAIKTTNTLHHQKYNKLKRLQNLLQHTEEQIKLGEDQITTFNLVVVQPQQHAEKEAELTRVRIDLETLRKTRLQLMGKIQSYQEEITQIQKDAEGVAQHNEWLAGQVKQCEQFLRSLGDIPESLVNMLSEQIKTAFDAYEEQHFWGLSSQVRISLMSRHLGLHRLIQQVPRDKHEDEVHPKNYLRLCGYLWDLYAKVTQENQNPAFIECLTRLLNRVHLGAQDDLPDPFAIDSTAEEYFQKFKKANPEIFAIQETDLLKIELLNFEELKSFLLKPDLPCNTSLQKKIIQAAWAVYQEVSDKKRKDEMIDYYFYTRIMRQLVTLFHNPLDSKAGKRLSAMAEYVTTTPSVGKKVLGSLLVIVGALLIAASVAGFVVAFGANSPLIVWGCALGFSLMQTQITLGVGLSLSTLVGAGLTFWGASTLSTNGNQGLSQELLAVQNEMHGLDRSLALNL